MRVYSVLETDLEWTEWRVEGVHASMGNRPPQGSCCVGRGLFHSSAEPVPAPGMWQMLPGQFCHEGMKLMCASFDLVWQIITAAS